jgi:hypothetical protein
MGRVYTASFTAVAISVAQDAFEITAPAVGSVIILSCHIGQYSDAGDTESELLPVNITRYATSGSGGSTPTARPHHPSNPAFGGSVEVNNTTQGGTPVVVLSDVFNVQAGWFYKPSHEERIFIASGAILAIELPVAPADAITAAGSITFMELAR